MQIKSFMCAQFILSGTYYKRNTIKDLLGKIRLKIWTLIPNKLHRPSGDTTDDRMSSLLIPVSKKYTYYFIKWLASIFPLDLAIVSKRFLTTGLDYLNVCVLHEFVHLMMLAFNINFISICISLVSNIKFNRPLDVVLLRGSNFIIIIIIIIIII